MPVVKQLATPIQMTRGSRKRLVKSEPKAVLVEQDDAEAEPFMTMKGLRRLCNILIEDGQTSATLESCMNALQEANASAAKPEVLVPCSFCGKKFGIKVCSGCLKGRAVRYCSIQCQLDGWPEHKTVCASRQTRN